MLGWIYSAKRSMNWESPKLFYLKSSWYSFPVSQHYCSKHRAFHNLAACDPFWKSLCNQMYWDFIIVICHTVRNRLIVLLSLVSCEHHSVCCALQMKASALSQSEREEGGVKRALTLKNQRQPHAKEALHMVQIHLFKQQLILTGKKVVIPSSPPAISPQSVPVVSHSVEWDAW